MTLVDNFDTAMKEIDKVRPHVLICEYELGLAENQASI